MHDNMFDDDTESYQDEETYNPANQAKQAHEDLILNIIAACTDHKGLPFDQIQKTAKRYSLKRGQVTQAIQRLENQGLVHRMAAARYVAG